VAPTKVNALNILHIWKRIDGDNIKKVRVLKPKYKLGQHVRISREKMQFANTAEQHYSTEIFRISKVTRRQPRPVYELHDLNDTPIVGQFYQGNCRLFVSQNSLQNRWNICTAHQTRQSGSVCPVERLPAEF
jgi:hypothetical protein